MTNTIIPSIERDSFKVLNPWESFESFSLSVKEIYSLSEIPKQNELLKNLNKDLSIKNEKMLQQAEIIVAVLDGADVDSGVAAELGYACALGKKIIGYRSDFRVSGDNSAAIVNVQIEYFINKSGGKIVRDVGELSEALNELRTDRSA